MTMPDLPLISQLGDGRIQLRHGPIDLVVEAVGSASEVKLAIQQATRAFATVLIELVDELDFLRMQSGTHRHSFKGKVASQMNNVAHRFSPDHFVTPMIAVAGAVADHVLQHMTIGRTLSKAYVNNGGDIAIYLAKEQCFDVGVCTNPYDGAIVSKANITGCSGIRGIATSGWRGRSHSLGIADSVTVLARTAAMADAAATLIANAIDLPGHSLIKREAANELSPDSDLGGQLVTVEVGRLTVDELRFALAAGQRLARSMIDAGEIIGVYGNLDTEMFSLHPLPSDHTSAAHDLQVDHLQEKLACA